MTTPRQLAILAVLIFIGSCCLRAVEAVAAPLRRKPPAISGGFNDEIFLDAIAAVESGNNPDAIGESGERTEYQFMPRTWAIYTRVPFAFAGRDRKLSRQVARDHLAALRLDLLARGFGSSPEVLAAGWRFGAGAARATRRVDSSQRVANLYFDFLRARQRKALRQ